MEPTVRVCLNFQITLSTYKLDSQNKNYIYKIKTLFFLAKKKASSHARITCDEASIHNPVEFVKLYL